MYLKAETGAAVGEGHVAMPVDGLGEGQEGKGSGGGKLLHGCECWVIGISSSWTGRVVQVWWRD